MWYHRYPSVHSEVYGAPLCTQGRYHRYTVCPNPEPHNDSPWVASDCKKIVGGGQATTPPGFAQSRGGGYHQHPLRPNPDPHPHPMFCGTPKKHNRERPGFSTARIRTIASAFRAHLPPKASVLPSGDRPGGSTPALSHPLRSPTRPGPGPRAPQIR